MPPLYSYRCFTCDKQVEAFRTIEERNLAPECHGAMEKILTPTFVKVFSPYVTAAFDKEQGKPLRIRNAEEHRAFLSRNAYEEVGTDRSMAPLSREEVEHNRAQRKDEAPFEWTTAE